MFQTRGENMKLIIASIAMVIAAVASAKDVNVYSERFSYDRHYDVEYGVNADYGRAWLVIDIEDWDDDDEDVLEWTKRAKIDGLAFNQDTEEINYTDENGVTVCAETYLKTRRIFGRVIKKRIITPTGNCTFKTRKEIRTIDTGYEVYKAKYTVVYMVVK
jgi:hypothetical protein